MGFFTKEDDRGRTKARVGRIATTSLASLFTATALWSGLYINEAREVSLEVRFGKVVDTITDPGINAKMPFLTSRYAYSLARQTIQTGEEKTLRTSDDVRLKNPFTIEYKIDETADLKNLYYQLKGSGDDIKDVIEKLTGDVAVRVFEGFVVSDLAETGFTDKIKTEIKTKLQADLAEKGWPVTVIDVLSSGFSLSEGSEDVLERIIDIRQEETRLELRQKNAEKAKDVLKTEAEAYVEYAKVLREAGVPEEDLRCAIYDKMALEAGRIMQPFAQICGNGTGTMQDGTAVSIDPAAIGLDMKALNQGKPAPAPQ